MDDMYCGMSNIVADTSLCVSGRFHTATSSMKPSSECITSIGDSQPEAMRNVHEGAPVFAVPVEHPFAVNGWRPSTSKRCEVSLYPAR